jgi:hypothetical protein
MPPRAEVLGNGSIGREKTLGMTGRLEPLHTTLTLARGAMRVFAPIVEITALTMFHPWQKLTFGGTIARELIRDDHPWHVLQAFEQLAKELLRGLLVATALHQDIEDVVILIHGTPQIMTLAVDRQKHLIEMPFVPGPGPSAPQLVRIILAKFETPLPDRFMGDIDTPG